MNIMLSDMQEKEVISIKTGLNYGHIIDCEIDNLGNIIKYVCKNKKLFKNMGEISFLYTDIEKIGEDVILVRI